MSGLDQTCLNRAIALADKAANDGWNFNALRTSNIDAEAPVAAMMANAVATFVLAEQVAKLVALLDKPAA